MYLICMSMSTNLLQEIFIQFFKAEAQTGQRHNPSYLALLLEFMGARVVPSRHVDPIWRPCCLGMMW